MKKDTRLNGSEIRQVFGWLIFGGIMAIILILLIIGEPANAQGFLGFGGSEEVEPGGVPWWAAFQTKIVHALGALFFIAIAVLVRMVLRPFLLPHRDLADEMEQVLKARYQNENTKREVTDAESRVISALVWKDTLSFISVMGAIAWIMVAL